VAELFIIDPVKLSNSAFIAFPGAITGAEIAIVFFPLFVSISKLKTFLSEGDFRFITSVLSS